MATATRVIVTSQPDVACDVCGRRLLRGEQPDTFLVQGRRRTVCELCAPRASAEGWVRETASQEGNLAPGRTRRGRNLLGLLRQARQRPADSERADDRRSARPGTGEPAPADTAPLEEPLAPPPSQNARPVAAVAFPAPEPQPAPALSEADVAAAGQGDTPDVAGAGPGDAPDVAGAGPGDAPDVGAAADALAPAPEEQGSWRDAWMFVEE